MAMQDLKTVKLKWWPSPQDYSEAVQAPMTSFSDKDLQQGAIFVNAMGLPKPVCGAFASVYRMRSASGDHAVRCFLRNLEDQERRYRLVSEFVQTDDLPYTVSFNFQRDGIKVNSDWFPLLKMDWVAGLTLDYYIAVNFRDSSLMSELAEKFLAMSKSLRGCGIAHGDLQHGNIIVCDGELRLVDYDGMFVPSMKGQTASELGHRNYQHPSRAGNHFGAYLDNFSDWVIYASIRALAVDPSLFLKFQFGDDSLLFKREDFLNPEESAVFRTLENHDESEIRSLVRFIRAQLAVDLRDVPSLQESAPHVVLAPLKPPEVILVMDEPDESGALPDWLQCGALLAEEEQRQNKLPEWMREDVGSFVAPTVVVTPAPEDAVTNVLNPDALEPGFEPELYRARPRVVVSRDGVHPLGAHFFVSLILIMMAVMGPFFEFAIWLIVICNALIAAMFWGWPTHALLAREGRVAKAVIVKVETTNTGGLVAYEFETHTKLKIKSVVSVTPAEYPHYMNRTEPVTVLYDAFVPSLNILYERSLFRAVY